LIHSLRRITIPNNRTRMKIIFAEAGRDTRQCRRPGTTQGPGWHVDRIWPQKPCRFDDRRHRRDPGSHRLLRSPQHQGGYRVDTAQPDQRGVCPRREQGRSLPLCHRYGRIKNLNPYRGTDGNVRCPLPSKGGTQ
jgi:hypothetical protein